MVRCSGRGSFGPKPSAAARPSPKQTHAQEDICTLTWRANHPVGSSCRRLGLRARRLHMGQPACPRRYLHGNRPVPLASDHRGLALGLHVHPSLHAPHGLHRCPSLQHRRAQHQPEKKRKRNTTDTTPSIDHLAASHNNPNTPLYLHPSLPPSLPPTLPLYPSLPPLLLHSFHTAL